MSAIILHKKIPVLNCNEFYIEHCQLVTDEAYTIAIYVTIYILLYAYLND